MPENAILQSLPHDERALITAQSSVVHFSALERLHRAGEPLEHVYFPLSGLISLQTGAQDGRAIETGFVGREGVVGGDAVWGTESHGDAIAQTEGDAVRVPAAL